MATLPKFKNPKLLATALTHRSTLNEDKTLTASNERMEFLGDSIISYLTSSYLFKTFPNLNEGSLTNLRSLLVKTDTLAIISKEIGLGALLKLSKGEEEGGGRENKAILADTFEAVIGALYLDQGLKAVTGILSKYLFSKAEALAKNESLKDAKSLFQEMVQERKFSSPVYKILKAEGPEHAKVFTTGVFVKDVLFGKGSGRSKQESEQVAASLAIEKFRKS